MKNLKLANVLLFCLIAFGVQSQGDFSWRKHLKIAEGLYSKAEYADAGEHYRLAWKKNMKNSELAYKAGECFFTMRDYRNAADAWKNVKDMNGKYPLIGLRYARSLKQSGEYEAASSELVNFMGQYQGTDKAIVSQVVQNELRGCELAAQLSVKGENKNVRTEHLSNNVNTPATEFAPFPFGDEALYFSSTMAKRAEIYRSLKGLGGDWSRATPIENFPVIESDHFCNGSLSPDASRFYFTICKSEESWGGLTTKCQIFVTKRSGKTWSTPEKLPDYINEANVTSTHPYVVHENGTEILYFSSNRPGGKGGMDIWYSTREIRSNANDFTLPVNTGSQINTLGDEITPYYDQLDGTLYFSSNGQITIGGQDIFKSKGARANWGKPDNMGTPFNSPADDFFFIKTSSGVGGYLVSNRQFGMSKVSTNHEDIFSFEYDQPVRQWVARGEVYDKSGKSQLNDVEVSIYEISDNGKKRFLRKADSSSGTYDFAVEPSTKYYIEAVKEGYFPNVYEFDTYDFATYTDFGAPIYLEEYGLTSTRPDKPTQVVEKTVEKGKTIPAAVTETKTVEPAVATTTTTQATQVVPVSKSATPTKTEAAKVDESGAATPYVFRGRSKDDNLKIVTEAPRRAGVYYKIQLAALIKYNANDPRFTALKANATRIDSEYIVDLKLYRVLLADYSTYEEAKAALSKVRAKPDFKKAYIVEYNDGERIGLVN